MIRIAIDGPSGSGKSTLAKAVARELGIIYVDTGALYRTVGYYVFTQGKDPHNAQEVEALLPNVKIELKYENGAQVVILNGEDLGDKIRMPEMSMYASAVSAIPAVRTFLLEMQKSMARENSVVMDGRDIGTVIIPDADIKIFLTANNETRAKRRVSELKAKGVEVTYEEVLSDMIERDKNDKNRDIAPAVPADDAIIFDNSEMSVEDSLAEIVKLVNKLKKKSGVSFEKEKRTYRFFYWLLAGVARRLYRVKVINPENEPMDRHFIVACNHTGAADGVIICAAMKNQIRFMSKKELFKVPVVGAFLKAIGCYPVDRKGSDISALRNTINLLKDEDCVGIFPQGTRMPGIDPSTTSVKNGVGLIAARSGADVLPVCIKTKGGKTKMFRRNYLVLGKLIKSEELDLENNKGSEGHQKIADRIFDEVCELWATTDIDNVK